MESKCNTHWIIYTHNTVILEELSSTRVNSSIRRMSESWETIERISLRQATGENEMDPVEKANRERERTYDDPAIFTVVDETLQRISIGNIRLSAQMLMNDRIHNKIIHTKYKRDNQPVWNDQML